MGECEFVCVHTRGGIGTFILYLFNFFFFNSKVVLYCTGSDSTAKLEMLEKPELAWGCDFGDGGSGR